IMKTDFQEPEQRDNRAPKPYFPVDLSSEEKREVHDALLILDECVKVFNPGLIRKTAIELRGKNEKYKELSHKLIMTADTYNESEFSQIIGDLLKGKENEN
ncbi:MAG: hypothetical protein JEY91_10445, partial [Spirochaetaceae bacterium]|nr:hypothetical protein [Spirochaetaceae bacterium]